MSNIWFTSDTHYHHKNIVTGVSDWENKGDQTTRDFKTLEEHDEHLVSQINKYVKQEDILWHLGDWSFGGIEQIWNFYKRLTCRNIHIVFGNHDHHIENNRELPNAILSVRGDIRSAEDGTSDYDEAANARDIFASSQHVYDGKIGQHSFFLSHYAHRVWNKSHHGKIHLYGHSHDSLDNKGEEWGKSMDVGMDAAKRVLGEYRPFHINEILRIMSKRQTKEVDHHNKNTN